MNHLLFSSRTYFLHDEHVSPLWDSNSVDHWVPLFWQRRLLELAEEQELGRPCSVGGRPAASSRLCYPTSRLSGSIWRSCPFLPLARWAPQKMSHCCIPRGSVLPRRGKHTRLPWLPPALSHPEAQGEGGSHSPTEEALNSSWWRNHLPCSHCLVP
jgi:hypothetical protein